MVSKNCDEIRQKLRELGDDFLDALKLEVDSCVLLADIDRLKRLTSIVHIHMDSEVIRILREKGYGEEIKNLCEKAGTRVV